MQFIQDLFDPSKKLNRKIESVITFGASTIEELKSEIEEYVVTQNLHDKYNDVILDLQNAFSDGSKEVGIWVSGFYGSGKSSFAKYLGLSFDSSLMIDGITFGEKLMNRIQDLTIKAMHNALIQRHHPVVIMIDLSSDSSTAGENKFVSDIVYYETLKQLGISKSTDAKVMSFIDLLNANGKYEEFCKLIEEGDHTTWDEEERNDLSATLMIQKYAPKVLPQYFPDGDSFMNVRLDSIENEKERFKRLYNLIKSKTGKENVIFVLDEVGQYIASDQAKILNVQGLMHTFKDEFKGKVWVIATAQQRLTEDNPNAQINSNELYRLNDRFPIKVDIEASDIKEIITRRLLEKSPDGKSVLIKMFEKNEGLLKNSTHLTLQERSIFNQVITESNFSDLYPFLPVHIDILMALLQKLASRTGGVGLRSVLRLIRDILVDNHLADASIGQLAGPEHFYDVLHPLMNNNATREIISSADKAIRMFGNNQLAVRICKTIAVIQILEDFNLSFDNLCALLYNRVGETIDKTKVRETIDEIIQAEGLTLQEIEGKFQFMTDAILGIREERNKILPRDIEKAEILQEVIKDILTPAPSVNIYNTKTITSGLELCEKNRLYNIYPSSTIKINLRFVNSAKFNETHNEILIESNKKDNEKTLFWICTLNKDKDYALQEIIRSKNIKNRHQNETNKEIQAYLRGQKRIEEEKTQELSQMLRDALGNSEIIFKGTPKQVNGETYRTVALKEIAEKVYEKYPLANCNMSGDCVSKLSKYPDLRTLPPALNPLGIVNTKDGTIHTNNPAISEIKDYISYRSEISGSELISNFEHDPYGWQKDTCRYLVALMLKASVVQIRVTGKDISVFSESAAEAMATNNSFGRISISLNTESALTIPEMIKAVQNLTALFNSSNVPPIKDRIASEALKQVGKYKGKLEKMLPTFDYLNLAGLPILQQAIGYINKIVSSEGSDAAYLLSKEPQCYRALSYAMAVYKCDESTNILDHLKHLDRWIKEAETLPQSPLLDDFKKKVEEVKTKVDGFSQIEDIHQKTSEISDLNDSLQKIVQTACTHFKTESNKQIDQTILALKQMPEYVKLTDSQKQVVDKSMNGLYCDSINPQIENLRISVYNYTSYYTPGNRIDIIKTDIIKMAQDQEPPATQQPNSSSSNTHEQNVKPCVLRVKRRISTRQDLESFIDMLNGHLNDISSETPLEFLINE